VPGILGWASRALGGEEASTEFRRALRILCHGPRFRSRVIHQDHVVALGVVYRREPPAGTWWSPDGRVLVIVYGRPLASSPSWRPADAEEIGARYLGHGVEGLAGLDGSFALTVLDWFRNRLFVLNDRTGSIPVVHAAGEGGIAFGPEAKALFNLGGILPRLDRGGALSFLNLGYPVGTQTLFEEVRQLPAGSFLDVDLGASRFAVGRYWDLRFAPRTRWRRTDAVATLGAAMEEAHRAVLSDEPERTHLLLTGGFDSRAVLGYLGAMGKPPTEAFTWGVDETLSGSDPAIARVVAASEGVPHRFLYYGAERFAEEAPRWVWVGELSSDNLGNYATGPDFFERAGVDPEVPVLIGDQMLGPGGFPATHAQAVQNITKVPWGGVRPELAGMMTPEGVREAGEALTANPEEIVITGPSDHPKDVQDYLYFHLYVVRWLHAPAYFREPMTSPRRPLLLAPVLDVGRQLPRRLRIDKTVLVELLRRRMPQLARYPIASAHSLVDWEYEVRVPGKLREFFLGLLDWEFVARTPVATLLDREEYLEAVERYFSEVLRPVDRSPSRLPWAMEWRRRLAGIPWFRAPVRAVEPLVKRILHADVAGNPGTVLRRVALLTLLQESIDAGRFGRGETGSSSPVDHLSQGGVS